MQNVIFYIALTMYITSKKISKIIFTLHHQYILSDMLLFIEKDSLDTMRKGLGSSTHLLQQVSSSDTDVHKGLGKSLPSASCAIEMLVSDTRGRYIQVVIIELLMVHTH